MGTEINRSTCDITVLEERKFTVPNHSVTLCRQNHPAMAANMFAYIWEYKVIENHVKEFRRIYGPDGEWVHLFRKAEGYIATELHQDVAIPSRFVSVDFWRSKLDRDRFRDEYAAEFKTLDERYEYLTKQEKFLGDFYTYSNLTAGRTGS